MINKKAVTSYTHHHLNPPKRALQSLFSKIFLCIKSRNHKTDTPTPTRIQNTKTNQSTPIINQNTETIKKYIPSSTRKGHEKIKKLRNIPSSEQQPYPYQ